MDWIHWIGRSIYTERRFIKEAAKYGVTRRISSGVLKAFSWGDRVYLEIKRVRQDKSGIVFGYFRVEGISGLSTEALKALDGKLGRLVDVGGRDVVRACGWYRTGASYTTGASVREIAEAVESTGTGKASLMLSGEFQPLAQSRLVDIPFQQGYRKFDGSAFQEALSEAIRSSKPTKEGVYRIKGMFYPLAPEKEEPEEPVEEPVVTSVLTYERRTDHASHCR